MARTLVLRGVRSRLGIQWGATGSRHHVNSLPFSSPDSGQKVRDNCFVDRVSGRPNSARASNFLPSGLGAPGAPGPSIASSKRLILYLPRRVPRNQKLAIPDEDSDPGSSNPLHAARHVAPRRRATPRHRASATDFFPSPLLSIKIAVLLSAARAENETRC